MVLNKHKAMNSFKKYSVKIILSFFCLLMLVSCKKEKEENSDESGENSCLSAKELKELEPITVENSKLSQELRLTGKVSYNPNRVVNYVSLVSGTLTKSQVSLGDKVEKNQVLAEIKSAELNEMETELRQLRSKLKVAERELASTQSFYDDEIASEKELIQAESEKESLESDLEKLESNLQLFQPGTEKNAFQIRAPRSGYVVNNQLVEGAQITAENEPLFTISDMDEVWVNMNVYATNIDFVEEGMPISIKTNSYPGKTFEGEIKQISQVIDPDENVVKARVVLKNEGLMLKPGLHVEGIVTAEKDQEMPRLPEKSVVYHNDKYYVVLIKDHCTLEQRQVEVYAQDETTMFIESGLQPGDEIVSHKTLLQFNKSTKN